MSKNARPIRSMTGFGRGTSDNSRAFADVELRTVNGKGLGFKLRLPSERMELEPKIESLLRKGLSRGNLQGNFRVRLLNRRASSIDHKLLRGYLKEWRALEKELGLERKDPNLSELLAMPGAIETTPETSLDTKAAARALTEATRVALQALLQAREAEGGRLKKELNRLIAKLEKLSAHAQKRAPFARKEAATRFETRAQEVWAAGGNEDSLDLSRELVVLAEKSDVQEELSRLDIHLSRLNEILLQGGACGREIEFLIQECHREITTLGNKSSDARLSELVVAMKVIAGQLKEQVANVE
ncbi:MAG TPA: YicC/YloC family endoribonuclease [Planctomycetota bacterium]|nr:YicC/YloC family endoribonuclease [Planctomycetota bacterium]MDP7245760.1 YicC/YloC family endoribonuclease [Planctomycetota bacterium]MDP7560805.1 YicC/YloC family endoribonuclease [Planctomycetota bacterium]HJM38750.1 YicC/YloC family endoribonuclease [Planctomycetota bacterium]